MIDTYEDFTAAVNDALAARGDKPLGEADQSTIIHCFGYGKSVKDAMFNVLHGRIFRASYTVFYEG